MTRLTQSSRSTRSSSNLGDKRPVPFCVCVCACMCSGRCITQKDVTKDRSGAQDAMSTSKEILLDFICDHERSSSQMFLSWKIEIMIATRSATFSPATFLHPSVRRRRTGSASLHKRGTVWDLPQRQVQKLVHYYHRYLLHGCDILQMECTEALFLLCIWEYRCVIAYIYGYRFTAGPLVAALDL